MRYILLIVPCIVALWVSLYNRVEPVVAGFPMFYWFQLLLIVVSALFILAAYKMEAK